MVEKYIAAQKPIFFDVFGTVLDASTPEIAELQCGVQGTPEDPDGLVIAFFKDGFFRLSDVRIEPQPPAAVFGTIHFGFNICDPSLFAGLNFNVQWNQETDYDWRLYLDKSIDANAMQANLMTEGFGNYGKVSVIPKKRINKMSFKTPVTLLVCSV